MPDLPVAQNPVGDPNVPQGSGQQADTQQITNAPFTPEQIQAMIPVIQEHSRKIAQDAANSAFRGMQSSMAKFEKSVSDKIKELTDLGITPTPEQKEIIQQNVRKQLDSEMQATESQPVQAQSQMQEPIDPIVMDAEEIFQEHGVRLEQGDPEVAMINQTTRAKFLVTLNEATLAKKNRLAKAAAINNPNNVPSAGQRTGQPNSIVGINDIDELYARARNR